MPGIFFRAPKKDNQHFWPNLLLKQHYRETLLIVMRFVHRDNEGVKESNLTKEVKRYDTGYGIAKH